MAARSISCSAWPAATNTFFGVQPRFGQVPPRSCDSIIATDIPARLTGPVTPMPALPPPRITTSNLSVFIELPRQSAMSGESEPARVVVAAEDFMRGRPSLLGRDGRSDRTDNHG